MRKNKKEARVTDWDRDDFGRILSKVMNAIIK